MRFSFDGETVEALPGDSIAAALAADGRQALRRTASGRARGAYCGMGVCSDCLVRVQGGRAKRACLTLAVEGMDVRTHVEGRPPEPAGTRASARPEPADAALPGVECDVLVVGAGPAGMHAALAAAAAGARVVVLDERHESGGQYYKPRSTGSRAPGAPDGQHRDGAALRERLATSDVELCSGETVWHARARDVVGAGGGIAGPGFDVSTWSERGVRAFVARAIVAATGAFERPAIVPGWTLPGVMTIGAAQTLARRYGVSPGAKVLVAGHGPLGLQLAGELLRLGVTVVALAERSRPSVRLRELVRAASAEPGLVVRGAWQRLGLLRRGVPVLEGWELTACEGADDAGATGVSAAVLEHLGSGKRRRFAVDAVCAGDGFVSQAELPRLLGCTVRLDAATGAAVPVRDENGRGEIEGLWIAGDAGGLEGAVSAAAQGTLAGLEAARHATQTAITRGAGAEASESRDDECRASASARRELASARRFQAALWSLYRAAPRAVARGETSVCRCEEVTSADVVSALDDGAADLGAVKRATRLGMGRCQGRYCVAQAVRLLGERGHDVPAGSLFSPQVPARPVPVSLLAREKPEWAGHRESRPAARPVAHSCAPLIRAAAELVVVGAGITGVCAALQAARRGARVVCLDRGRINGEASGGNAGSLHLQLLSWDFGAKAFAGGSAALATLVLQRESIASWRELERELAADFEMVVTGGLMVAEDVRQVAFLEAKVAAEASVGIRSEVVDGERIRGIAPAVAERMVAGAWCPGEGKINPLAAMPPLVRAARQAGVTFEEGTPVTGIERAGRRYRLVTPRGEIAADRVLLAAGGWSSALGAMLGTRIPVRGAPLQMIVTERAPPLVPCLLAHADRHLTMKQSAAGTVIIGGAWTAETSAASQARTRVDSLEGNLWVAERTVPAIGDLHVLRSWAAMNIDIDGAPLLSALPGHPRVVVAATANGYTLGPLMGREAANLALDEASRPDLVRFDLARFDSPTRETACPH